MKEKLLKKKVVIPTAIVLVLIIIIASMSGGGGEYIPAVAISGDGNGYAQASGGGETSASGQPQGVHAVSLRSEDFAKSKNILDDRIYAIEINQALSRGLDTTTGEFFLLNHFVGGRETAVFVMFDVPVDDLLHAGISPFLAIYKDGEFVAELDWRFIIDDYTLLFQPTNMSDVGDWAVGEYAIEVWLDGELAAYRAAHFHQSSPYRVLLVPVTANYSGTVIAPSGIWMTGAAQIAATFPVARADLDIVLGAALDLSHLDIDNPNNLRQLWIYVNNLQTRGRDYDAIVGIVAHPMGGFLGFTYGAPTVIASESDPELISTVVHEIAHLFGIGDEYEGGAANPAVNMMPYGMTGWDMVSNMMGIAGSDLSGYRPPVMRGMDVEGFFGEGSPIFPMQRPYYVAGNLLLHNPISYMSSGGINDPWRLWVTSDQWIHKHRILTGVDIHLVDSDTRTLVLQNASSRIATFRPAQIYEAMALEIRGALNANGTFTPLPWYHFEIENIYLDSGTAGNYSVVFFDASGAVISQEFFNVSFEMEISAEDGQRSFITTPEAAVDLLFEFPLQTARIAIYHGDDELHSVTLSQTAPTVSFTGLADDQQLGDSVTLTWDAAGEGELFFEIWYSPDDDVYINIATDITGRSFTADLTQLPGTSEGFFYIYVTDGVRTATGYSPWIQVPYKAPIIVTRQTEIPRITVTDEFVLEVDIYDKQDGWLWDLEEVEWTLDGELFMAGDVLWVWPFELAPGEHIFTITAANSVGLTVSGEFSLYIVDDDSALPDDWSRVDIVTALANGYAIDLRRLDMPINRGRFAEFINTLYVFMHDDEDIDYMYLPEYVEGQIIDGGATSYEFFLMVYFGLMEAPSGRFNPNGTITQLEAALIMYRIAELADPDWFGAGASDAEILDWLYSQGILDESGPNALNESQPLTNRLAMVRLGRLYQAVFE